MCVSEWVSECAREREKSSNIPPLRWMYKLGRHVIKNRMEHVACRLSVRFLFSIYFLLAWTLHQRLCVKVVMRMRSRVTMHIRQQPKVSLNGQHTTTTKRNGLVQAKRNRKNSRGAIWMWETERRERERRGMSVNSFAGIHNDIFFC